MTARPRGRSPRPAEADPAPPRGERIQVYTTAEGHVGLAIGSRGAILTADDAAAIASDLLWAVEVIAADRATRATALRGARD